MIESARHSPIMRIMIPSRRDSRVQHADTHKLAHGPVRLTVTADGVARTMSYIVAALIALHVLSVVLDYGFGLTRQGGFRWAASLDMEQNPGAWYQTVSLSFCSLLLAGIGCVERRTADRRWPYWLSLSALFGFLSLDEMASLHERISEPLRRLIGGTGVFRFAWIVAWGLLLVAVAVTHVRFLLSLPAPTRTRFVVAGLLFVTGAIGGEMVEGLLYSRLGHTHHLAYELFVVLEETLEMAGVVLFTRALLLQLAASSHGLTLQILKNGELVALPKHGEARTGASHGSERAPARASQPAPDIAAM